MFAGQPDSFFRVAIIGTAAILNYANSLGLDSVVEVKDTPPLGKLRCPFATLYITST